MTAGRPGTSGTAGRGTLSSDPALAVPQFPLLGRFNGPNLRVPLQRRTPVFTPVN